MERKEVESGKRVKIAFLDETMGMPVDYKYLQYRNRTDIIGIVLSSLPDSKDEIWLVQHEGCDEIAAYSFHEMEPA